MVTEIFQKEFLNCIFYTVNMEQNNFFFSLKHEFKFDKNFITQKC